MATTKTGPKRNDAGALCIKGQPFMWQLTTIGTREMSCFGAVAEAVALQNEIGKEQIAARGRQLAGYLRQRMAETGWVEPLSSPHPDLANSISTFRLKGFGATNPGQLLYDKYRITTPVWGRGRAGLYPAGFHPYLQQLWRNRPHDRGAGRDQNGIGGCGQAGVAIVVGGSRYPFSHQWHSIDLLIKTTPFLSDVFVLSSRG